MKKIDYRNRKWVLDFYGSAVGWWGESWYDGSNLEERAIFLAKYIPQNSEILELGAGTGETARYLAKQGYKITAIDIAPENFDIIQKIAKYEPSIQPILGDFLKINLNKHFDAVVLFEAFGMGSDKDQRTLLERISREWLKPEGVLIMDVYHPYGPIRVAGQRMKLDALEDVPTSVAMTQYQDYDPMNNRWVNTWEPVDHPENVKSQSIRCYAPSDLMMLMNGLDLNLKDIFIDKKRVNYSTEFEFDIPYDHLFEDDFSYRTVFKKEG